MDDEKDVIVIELGIGHLLALVAIAVAAVALVYWSAESLRPGITVAVDRREYQPGDAVTISGFLRGGWSAMAGVDVGIEVRDPSSQVVWIDQVETGSDGTYSSAFRLHTTASEGDYTVYASSYVAAGTSTFRVARS